MSIADLINGSFEGGAALVNVLSIRELLKHREIKGVHWGPNLLFAAWGFFNLYYYPHLHQWFSFGCAICLTAMNCVWLALLIKFQKGVDTTL